MTEDDRAIVRDFKERLVHAGVPVAEACVFGSRARGDATPESDLDVCLIVRERTPAFERIISRIAWQVGFERGRVITTVEYEPEEFERPPLSDSPFILAIRREGVAV